MTDSRIKITVTIEAENIDALVREVLERFGIERPKPKPEPIPFSRLENIPPAISISPRIKRHG